MKTLMVYSRPSIQSTLKKSNLKRVPNQILNIKAKLFLQTKIGKVGHPLSTSQPNRPCPVNCLKINKMKMVAVYDFANIKLI